MSEYAPLHVHSYYSLLDGMPSPLDIVKKCKDMNIPGCALTDHGSIAGLIPFHEAGKKYGIKTISAIELYVCENDPSIKNKDNNKRYHLTILAKDMDGFDILMRLVSETNRPDYFYRKPRIDLKGLEPFAKTGKLICLSGCLAGELSSSLFDDVNAACNMNLTKSQVVAMLKENWKDIGIRIAKKYQKIFGKENYFIEIQDEEMPVQSVVVDCLRVIASDLGIPCVATLDAHYLDQKDAENHRILLYAQMHTTQEEQEKLKESDGDTMAFFHMDTFYLYSPEDMQNKYTKKEIENTLTIMDMCSSMKINRAPSLPKYTSDQYVDKDSDEIIYDLCIRGAKEKLNNLDKNTKQIYWHRLQQELRTIKEAGLADYLLIVWDACNFVDINRGPRGAGRGSGAGSLVNYLLGITKVDPIKYGLYFERFYNASRNIPPHFNVGQKPFMKWYEDNFDNLRLLNVEQAKFDVISHIKKNNNVKSIKDHIKYEIDLIDKNNKRMWCYILDQINNNTSVSSNPSNSYIGYSLGLNSAPQKGEKIAFADAHISLPDIDTDIGVDFRDRLIEYLVSKWGEDYVAQMITFGRLQGKAALKEVFRAQPDTVKQLMKVRALKLGKNPDDIAEKPSDVCNEITKHIPDEAYIADELQQIREETGDDDYGILRWSVDHVDAVADAYKWYKPLFDQAMDIEGTKKSASKHAAGIVISSKPIGNIVPLTYDARSKTRICGFEMNITEKMGGVKFDFLGVSALDKIKLAEKLINDQV